MNLILFIEISQLEWTKDQAKNFMKFLFDAASFYAYILSTPIIKHLKRLSQKFENCKSYSRWKFIYMSIYPKIFTRG